ncbi:MAG: 4Fe-4S binding protein [Candidatus Krumholzibacteriales bacterium]
MKTIKNIALSILLGFIPFSGSIALAPKQHVIKRKIDWAGMLTEPRYLTKYIIMLAIGIFAFILLKSGKMNRKAKVAILLISLTIFGIAGNFISALGLQPSPVCAAVKPFLLGLRAPFMVFLSVIMLLTLLGPKLFCGWVCPVGAVQELISMISDKLGIRRWNFSFRLSNGVRIALLAAFFLLSVTSVIHLTRSSSQVPVSLYYYFNAFHGLTIESQGSFAGYIRNYLPFILTFLMAFILYRPYCHFICPIGLYTNIVEQFAIFRVSLNQRNCNNCSLCIRKSPCKALPHIVGKSKFRADCFACNRCLHYCRRDGFIISMKRVLRDNIMT